jgi:predicted nucleotidyltransferase
MSRKLYTIAEIKKSIQPVAERYGVERVLLFGSYARGNARPGSDIDFRIDSGAICGFFMLAGFHRELEEALGTHVDVLTTGALDDQFLSRIKKEEVLLYERPRQ